MTFHWIRPALLASAMGFAFVTTGCGRLVWTNEAPEIRSVTFTLERGNSLTWDIEVQVYDDDDFEFLTVEAAVLDDRGAEVVSPSLIDLLGGGGNTYHFSAPVTYFPELDPTRSYDVRVTVTDLTGEQDDAMGHYEPVDLFPPEILDFGWECAAAGPDQVFVAWADIQDADGPADVVEAGIAFYATGSSFGQPLASFPLEYDLDVGLFQYEEFDEYLPSGVRCDEDMDAVIWAFDSLGLYGEGVLEAQ